MTEYTERRPIKTALGLGSGAIFKPVGDDGREANYYELDDGTQLPRVSSVTKVVANPYLEGWKQKIIKEKMTEELSTGYARSAAQVDDILDSANRVASEAADVGTKLHKFIEDYLDGKEVIGYSEATVQALIDWLAARPWMEYYGSEKAIYVDERGGKDAWGNSLPVFGEEPLWYAGSLDALFWDHSNQCWHIVDWKTTKNGQAYPDNAMQIAAYCYALHSMIRIEDSAIYGERVTTHRGTKHPADGSLEGELANRHTIPYGKATIVVFDNVGGQGKAKVFTGETKSYAVDPVRWLPRFRAAHYLGQHEKPPLESVASQRQPMDEQITNVFVRYRGYDDANGVTA